MIGTIAEQPAPAHELAPWRDGRATLRVVAATDADLLREAVTGLLEAAGARPTGEQRDRSVAIRGEGADLAGVAGALFASAVDQIETLQIAVAGVELDGIVRADAGLIAWGRLTLADGEFPSLRPIRVLADPDDPHGGLSLVVLAEDAP